MRRLFRITPVMAMYVILAAAVSMAGVKHSSVGSNWIGASIQTVNSDLADAFELPISFGVIINRVIDDAPAQKAGLLKDDIVIAFNSSRVTDEEMLRSLIADSKQGDKVTLTVMRGDEKKDIEVVIEQRNDQNNDHWNWKQKKGPRFGFFRGPAPKYSGPSPNQSKVRPYLGVMMSNLTEQLGDYFGAGDGEGALITEVREDSPAEEAGLKAGDVIVKVGDNRVGNSGDVSELINDKEVGEEVELSLLRDKRSVTIKATLGETDDLFFGSLAPFDDDIIDLSGLNGLGKLGNLRTLRFGAPGASSYFDDDYKSDMEQLRQELRELQKEMKELQGSRK